MHYLRRDDSAPKPGLEPAVRVAYVQAYRAPDYVRSQSLLSALGSCDGVQLRVAVNNSSGWVRYLETWRAFRRLRENYTPDIYVLGFRGHEIFWPLRLLTRGAPLIFDALMSPSDSLGVEKKAGFAGRLLAPFLRSLERGILNSADLVLTDTELHAAFYVERFGLPRHKVLALPVGAIEGPRDVRHKSSRSLTGEFSVLFYGSMLPLHGVEVVIAAAAMLKDLPVRLDFIGGDAKQSLQLHQLCERLAVSRYVHRRWAPLKDLVGREIPNADLCLGGPFGGTPQARRVITSKASQSLALGKATVIGAIDEDVGFVDKVNCLKVPQADPTALAAAVRWAFVHRKELATIGERGRTLYQERLSIQAIARKLCPALQAVHSATPAQQ